MYQAEGGIYAGNLLLDVLDANGNQAGERDVGNTVNFTINPMKVTEKQKLGRRIENYGSITDSVILDKPQDLKFTLNDINKKNMALAMFGDDSVIDVAASTVTDEEITARLDKEVKLSKLSIKSTPAVVVTAPTPAAWQATHAYVLTNFVSKVAPNAYRYECTVAGTSAASEPTWPTTPGETVTDGTVTWTCRKLTYILATDYEIDYNFGTLKALLSGDIPDAQALLVDFSYNAYIGYKVQANTLTKIDCLLRLKGKNLKSGKYCMIVVYKCALKPTGAIDWITEDFSKLEFTGDIQAVPAGTWEATALD